MTAKLTDKVKAISERALSKKATENALRTYPQRVKKTNDPASLSIGMSHALTNAAHRLTLNEKRIMMFAIAKIDSRRLVDSSQDMKIVITAAEYAKVYKVAANTSYEELKSAVDKLYGRTIGWREGDLRDRSQDEGEDERWITGKKYHKGEGWMHLYINRRILPTLTGLVNKFTSYKLQQASALRSVYSWRLLELLSQYKKSGWRQIELPDLTHALEVPEAYAKNFAQMRRWVIELAIKELKAKDGWEINWEPIKDGRKVVAIRFDFKRNPQQPLPL